MINIYFVLCAVILYLMSIVSILHKIVKETTKLLEIFIITIHPLNAYCHQILFITNY